jgi:hypothetical protein
MRKYARDWVNNYPRIRKSDAIAGMRRMGFRTVEGCFRANGNSHFLRAEKLLLKRSLDAAVPPESIILKLL